MSRGELRADLRGTVDADPTEPISAVGPGALDELGAEGVQLVDDGVGAPAGAADEVRASGLGVFDEGIKPGWKQKVRDIDLVRAGGLVRDAAGDDEPLLGAGGEVRALLEDATIAGDGGICTCGKLVVGRIESSMGGAQLQQRFGLDGQDLLIGGT